MRLISVAGIIWAQRCQLAMDEVSTADLLNLLLVQRSSIDLQFQFWLTITFAVLAASFVAGHRLRWGLRWLAAFLYAMASAHLILRWMYDGTVRQHWVEALNRRSDTRDSGRARRPTEFLDPGELAARRTYWPLFPHDVTALRPPAGAEAATASVTSVGLHVVWPA